MSNKSLIARLRTGIRPMVMDVRRLYFNKIWGMDIGDGVVIALSARLDKTHPKGIHIGEKSGVAFGAAILTHDFINGGRKETRIGKWCHIGAHVIVMPGVTIGEGCIVAAGSVVMRDIEAHSLVAGNPARVVEKNIVVGPWGIRQKDFVEKHGDPAFGAAATHGIAGRTDT